jgi:hypothetical protein
MDWGFGVLFYGFMIGEAQAMLGARQFIIPDRKMDAPIDRNAIIKSEWING